MNYLIKIGLMPEDELERKKLELLNPYELRTKALDQALLILIKEMSKGQ